MFESTIELQKWQRLMTAAEEAETIPPCMTVGGDLFFNDDDKGQGETRYKEAKSLCKQCPIQRECLTYALENEELHGVWGGLAPKERQRLRGRGVA